MSKTTQRLRNIKWAIPTVFILWTVLMLIVTLLPSSAIPGIKLFSYDKIGHFAMFAGWTFFLGLYMIVYKQKTDINLYLLVLIGIIFGSIIEAMQFFLPGDRIASWGDILANSLGSVTAFLILNPIKRYLNRHN